ncbi:hypothetical protein C943_03185 [Mariniradius saccharolyticus AK6]|jgi:hypothetical protein|uniref:DUF2007 domain-containing protein n=1 Tax=Mariniradius saccharolyticus AK6 TaxID=1239962 RepID=M7XK43_9BACT|nr:DUF2007 domain-containing protein [Mariniradius saccharolyticus]EMS34863.1 hypothetical protein C943_03185 [Mariniradius saccharolyticus AK6]
MDNWQPVFKDSSPVRVEIVKAILEENDIPAVVLNKQESVYKLHGAYEVLVPKNEFLKAINIVKNEITF